jgi:hypothetical protein
MLSRSTPSETIPSKYTGTTRIADSIATWRRDLMRKRYDMYRGTAIEIISVPDETYPFSIEVRIRTRLRSDSHLRAFG